ncbi:MAG: thioredoxin family protein [Tissierellia bacterium]|nr:thioredoxin family protein [Tissierellia bacterium]
MDIKVIGAGCKDCDTIYENTVKAVSSLGIEGNVEKIEKLAEMVKLGVMTSPALLIDQKLYFAGQVPSQKTIEKKLKQLQGK